MRVQFTVVGSMEQHEDRWAELEAPPSVGDVVAFPGVSQAESVVRTVVWYPFGDEVADEPFVYVVLGTLAARSTGSSRCIAAPPASASRGLCAPALTAPSERES